MILLSCLGSIASAQVSAFDIEYPYKGYITRLEVDASNYVWMHNDEDYLKYDGGGFTLTQLKEIEERDDVQLRGDIVFVGDSILFTARDKVGLFHPHSKKKKYVFSLPEDYRIDCLYEDEKKDVWLFTSNSIANSRPVYKLDKTTLKFNVAFDLFPIINDQEVDWDYNVKDKDGLFYFLWTNSDLVILDGQGSEVLLPIKDREEFIATKECKVFRIDNKGHLWRMDKSIFEVYNSLSEKFERHPISGKLTHMTPCSDNKNSPIRIFHIHIDQKNRIFLGGESSNLFLFKPKDGSIVNFRKPLVKVLEGGAGDIKLIKEDKDGNIWGIKRGGVFKIRDKESHFDNYLVDTQNEEHDIYEHIPSRIFEEVYDLRGDNVYQNATPYSITEEEDGRIIVQDGRFTYDFNPKDRSIKALPLPLNGKGKTNIFIEGDTRIYCTWDAYYTFDENYEVKRKKAPLKLIDHILKTKDRDVWVSGRKEGLNTRLFAKLDQGTLEFQGNYQDPKGLLNFDNTRVNNMVEEEYGNLWLPTTSGIFFLDNQEGLTSYKKETTFFGSKKITWRTDWSLNVKKSQKDYIWIYDSDQVALFNTRSKSIEKYIDNSIFNSNLIMGAVFYGDSVTWVEGNKGMHYYNFNTEKHIFFSQEEGAGVGARGMRVLSSGEIGVCTHNGFFLFHPDSLLVKHKLQEEQNAKVSLELSSYTILKGKTDSLFNIGFLPKNIDKIELAYNDKMLQFNFALLNYNSLDSRFYKYKLEGYDTRWSSAQKENYVKFTSLPPGKYVFKVKGSIKGDNWDNEVLSVPIIVHQAWFRTWWFWGLCTLSLGLIIYSLLYFYFKQKLEKRLAIEKLRTKISSDLHDDVGSILTGLAMQSEILEYTIDEKNKKKVSRLSQLSRSAMSRMRDAVWTMDARRDNWDALMDRMNEFAFENLEPKGIKHHVVQTGIKPHEKMATELRQHLYLIFKEAITNIVKHSNADEVKVLLKKEKGKFTFSIHDNGTTSQGKSKSAGQGLSNIKMRAGEINAKLDIRQEDGFLIFLEVGI